MRHNGEPLGGEQVLSDERGRRGRLFRTLFLVGIASVLLVLTFLGSKPVLERFVRDRTKPWAVFQMPETPITLAGLEAKLAANVVTICNHDNREWSNVFVQIDQGYLATLDHLRVGECKQLAVQDFATESWKRLPPPRDLQVTRVAVLATVHEKRYAQKSLLH